MCHLHDRMQALLVDADVHTERIAHIPHTDPVSGIHPKNIPLEFRRDEPGSFGCMRSSISAEQHAIPIPECFMQRSVRLLR